MQKITVDEWRYIAAGHTIYNGFGSDTCTAPKEPGIYTMYELVNDGNTHAGFTWKRENLLGITYEDPEGIWEIISEENGRFTVRNIQENNLNYNHECVVSTDELCYFLHNKYPLEVTK